MLKRARPLARRLRPKMGVRTSSVVRCDGHLKWTRGNKCLVERPQCFGGIEAHHVRENGNGGTGAKPGDDAVVPLCALHHAELHRIGAQTFQRVFECDLDRAAAENWEASPHRIKLERKLEGR